MSEIQSRPLAPRGRGGFSSRGGRGRGGRGGRADHAIHDEKKADAIEDDGEVAQLKKKYGDKVDTIKEIFPDWTDEDVVMGLEETDGDMYATLEKITTGKSYNLGHAK